MMKEVEELTAKSEAALQLSRDQLKGRSPPAAQGGLW